MSKRTRARRSQREAKSARQQAHQPRRKLPWKAFLGWGTFAVLGGGLAVVLILGGGGGSAEENPEFTSLASALAGDSVEQDSDSSDIRVYSGSAHTVYHSTKPLPTNSAPQADGKPTLVWFSATWCQVCERMEPFVLQTASGFSERMVFVEKSVDHDRSAARRFGVQGTPTFVMLDARGDQITRFFFQGDASGLAEVIEAALARVPA